MSIHYLEKVEISEVGISPDEAYEGIGDRVHAAAWRKFERTPSHVLFEDLLQDGLVGMLEAAQRFDTRKGVEFGGYAARRINGEMNDGIHRQNVASKGLRRVIKRVERARVKLGEELRRKPKDSEIAEELGVELEDYHALRRYSGLASVLSLDAPVANDNSTPIVEQVANDGPSAQDLLLDEEFQQTMLYDALMKLDERTRDMIVYHHLDGLELAEVGEIFGVTDSRIGQIVGKGRERLAEVLGDYIYGDADLGPRERYMKEHGDNIVYQSTPADPPPKDIFQRLYDDQRFVDAVDEATQRLPEVQRVAMDLKYVLGMSNREIATELEIEPRAATYTVNNAKRNLKNNPIISAILKEI